MVRALGLSESCRVRPNIDIQRIRRLLVTATNRVLAICVRNNARSQMAEAYINRFGEGRIVAESAGFEPGKMNSLVVEVMREDGFNLYGKETNCVFDFFRQGRFYNYVVTVCAAEYDGNCPNFFGVTGRMHWALDDPSRLTGSYEEKLEKVRRVRDTIRDMARVFVDSLPR